MSHDFNDLVRSGSVKIRAKLGVTILKPRWLVLKRASSTGPDRLEVCKRVDDNRQVKVIPLTSIKSLNSSHFRDNMVDLETNVKTFQFCFESEDCCKLWLNELAKFRVGATDVTRSFLAIGHSMIELPHGTNRQNSLAEFHVFLLPSPILAVSGECLLVISSTTLKLKDIENTSRVLVSWDLNTLRKYGRNVNSFYIESGSRSRTGEGLFTFNTVHAESIYEKIHQATLALASAVRIYRTGQ